MHRNRSVDTHQFAMIPRAEIPRSKFNMQKSLKTTFDAGYLVPVLCEEVLPGDTFNLRMTCFARLATPIFPVMDNLYLDSFFFFIPNRLVWTNWVKFMGEQDNPADSISYSVPKLTSPASGFAIKTVYDYFGLPTVGVLGGGGTVDVSTLPLRGYNRVYNDWFKDENLINNAVERVTDGGDLVADFNLLRRGKRHDYFTSCLPWPQKGGTAVTIPLGTSAPVIPNTINAIPTFWNSASANTAGAMFRSAAGANTAINIQNAGTVGSLGWDNPNLRVDLSTATAATINSLRLAFQTQRFLEREARGGSRYTELIRSHFGVISPDARLQRTEYLGGGTSAITISPIAQTSASGVSGGTTPLGNLAAMGTTLANGHGFTQSFTEHGYILGLVSVRADLTYQQGLRRHWRRTTRYDYYFPVFAALGEQAVDNREIYARGDANDALAFGYQERWAEYRYTPSEITGLFRSTSAGTIDSWHLAQKFTVLPTLGQTFIEENPPLARVLAVGAGADGQQLIGDFFFNINAARPMPLYSVPGLIDHF